MKKIKSAEEHDPAALAMAEQHLLAESGREYQTGICWAGPDTAEKLKGELHAALQTWLALDGETRDERQIAALLRKFEQRSDALGMKSPLPPGNEKMSVPAARRWVRKLLRRNAANTAAKTLNREESQILEALKKSQHALIYADLAERANLSDRTCKKYVPGMIEKGFIVRVGERKGFAPAVR